MGPLSSKGFFLVVVVDDVELEEVEEVSEVSVGEVSGGMVLMLRDVSGPSRFRTAALVEGVVVTTVVVGGWVSA